MCLCRGIDWGCSTGLFVVMSYVQRDFSTALSSKDIPGFYKAIWQFVGIIIVCAPLYSFYVYMQVRSHLILPFVFRSSLLVWVCRVRIMQVLWRSIVWTCMYKCWNHLYICCRTCLASSGGHGWRKASSLVIFVSLPTPSLYFCCINMNVIQAFVWC